jgi:hypothetical protein
MDFLATFRLNRPRRLLAVVCQPQHEETVRWGRVYGGLVRSWGRWGGRRGYFAFGSLATFRGERQRCRAARLYNVFVISTIQSSPRCLFPSESVNSQAFRFIALAAVLFRNQQIHELRQVLRVVGIRPGSRTPKDQEGETNYILASHENQISHATSLRVVQAVAMQRFCPFPLDGYERGQVCLLRVSSCT